MCRVDPYVRLNANNNGEIKCIIFVDDLISAREKLKNFTSVIVSAYPFISGFGALVSVHKLNDLASLPFVKAISSHTTVTTCLQQAFHGLSIEYAYNDDNRGENTTVAVIDTGLNPHMDYYIPKKRAHFVDFINGALTPYDDNGHGTAVGSIICGNGLLSGGRICGVAPKTNLIMLKAIGAVGEGGAFAILEAMQWIYNNHKNYNIKVVCMSFGSEPIIEGLDPLSMGAEALWKAGIVVVASAGNDGPQNGTIKSPAINPNIITVGGAKIENGIITVPDFSSRGNIDSFPKPDVIAPAVDIQCCGIKEQYTQFSGTSMAAPIVTGLAALILSRYENLTPDRVKELIMQNAIKTQYEETTAGAGLVNLAFYNDI